MSVSLLLLLTGCGASSFLVTPVANTSELQEISVQPGRAFGGKIAIIEVEGMLLDDRSGGILQPSENPLSLFVQQLNRAADDDSVKAVVLRVNSPGGSVTTSDVMYDALLRFKNKTHKPVIASAQEMAASGAYYVSCAADKIIVNPTSIVGSIGVIFESFDFQDTLEKLGAREVSVKSAPMKDMGSPYVHLTPEARQVMQNMVDEYFARFKNVVVTSRGIKDPDTLKLVTDGRVFSGERAVQLGLADQTGRLNDAIELAREMGHAPGAEVVMYKRPYGYSGSIYAEMPGPLPRSNDLNLKLPMSEWLPNGFYYLWQP
ncbi:MAG TPA: signal peptide peptidase SppA [Tepidisphaeraceae bacterium]|jgi:protease-4|nr:signal peptide peptidase SppA [Tepidisphaeraceae bacterium]